MNSKIIFNQTIDFNTKINMKFDWKSTVNDDNTIYWKFLTCSGMEMNRYSGQFTWFYPILNFWSGRLKWEPNIRSIIIWDTFLMAELRSKIWLRIFVAETSLYLILLDFFIKLRWICITISFISCYSSRCLHCFLSFIQMVGQIFSLSHI